MRESSLGHVMLVKCSQMLVLRKLRLVYYIFEMLLLHAIKLFRVNHIEAARCENPTWPSLLRMHLASLMLCNLIRHTSN